MEASQTPNNEGVPSKDVLSSQRPRRVVNRAKSRCGVRMSRKCFVVRTGREGPVEMKQELPTWAVNEIRLCLTEHLSYRCPLVSAWIGENPPRVDYHPRSGLYCGVVCLEGLFGREGSTSSHFVLDKGTEFQWVFQEQWLGKAERSRPRYTHPSLLPFTTLATTDL
jgi:hypothetical protein